MPWPARSGLRPVATVGSGSRRRKTPLPGPTVAIEGLVAYAGTASRLVTGVVAVGCDHTRILGPNVALLKGRQVTAVQEHGVAGAEDLLLQRGAYLASTEGIRCESRSEGLKGLLRPGAVRAPCHWHRDDLWRRRKLFHGLLNVDETLHCGLKGGWKWARNPEAWTSIIRASSKDSPANGTSAPVFRLMSDS